LTLDPRLTAALADRYRLERELGAGGMATVYLAEDLKHDRKVAIKVLRPELSAVIGTERFLREIKTIANLQHPHILGLIDSGEVNGAAYYVMPFVEGESLRDRLTREKQLPVPDAVRLATEIADALDYAHRHGVIHRDIKPENVLLHDGRAMVADFGIALAVSSASGSRMTETGLSLGTPHYMSPEQAMGEREITGRSDVYALGCVTYEMLAGEPPFTGPTAQAIVAKVMTAEPVALSALRKSVPAQVEGAVSKALEKLPADRWGSAAEFAQALTNEGRGEVRKRGRTETRSTSPLPSFRTPLIGAGLVVLALAAAFWLGRRSHTDTPAAAVRFEVDDAANPFNLIASQPLAISPDGRTIAYVGAGVDRLLYVRTIDQITPRPLAGTRNATTPFFSPDGRWIAYFTSGTTLSRGKLVKIPVDGGEVVDIEDNLVANGGVWTPEGRIVLGTQAQTGGLSILAATGGTPVSAIDSIAGDPGLHRFPRLLPDGETVLFTSWNSVPGTARLGVASLRTHRSKILDLVGGMPLGVLDGYLVYLKAPSSIMAVAFDLKNWTTRGEPVQVLEGVSVDGSGGMRVAMNQRGDLLYEVGADDRGLVLVNLEGKVTPLLGKPGAYSSPRFSPDGKRIALDIATPAPDTWVYDRAGGTLDRVTTDGESDRPEWMPDGKHLLVRRSRGGRSMLAEASANGSGPSDSLLGFKDDVHEVTVGPDGRTIVFRSLTSGGGRDLWSAQLGGSEPPRPVLATPFQELQPRLSPNGRWLAYLSDESGRLEVYVRPMTGEGGRVRVSADGGNEVMWSPKGDRLFYRADRRMMVATVTAGNTFAVTQRALAFEGDFVSFAPHANFDVSPDGQTLVMIVPASGGAHLVMVHDWLTEFRARIAGAGRTQ